MDAEPVTTDSAVNSHSKIPGEGKGAPPAHAGAPVFSFSNGILRVDIPLAKMRLQWRPKPQAEELAIGRRQWAPFFPEFRLLRPPQAADRKPGYVLELPVDESATEVAEQKAMAYAAFRAEIEPEIVRIVEPFGSRQWSLMTLMHDEPWAMDLAVGNPVLAYALANSNEFRRSPPAAAAIQARWYCHRKQRELLEWLGFPASEAVAKVIRKIPPESASPSILRRLNNALKADKRVLEYLSHLPVVNIAVLELVTIPKYLDLITPKLLMEVAGKPGEASIGDMINGGMVILEQIVSPRKIKPLESVKQACRFREMADAEYQAHLHRQEMARQEAKRLAEQERHRQRMVFQEKERERNRQLALRPYPSPPVPGTKDIIPLTSAAQLEDEGWAQGNCVATYLWRVLAGSTYIYQVMAPERATLAIVRGADGCWFRAELNGDGNRKVKATTRQMVDMWLEGVRLSV